MDLSNMAFSEAVRQARREAGLSQGKFAALIGVTPSLVSHWERNKRTVSPDTAQRVRRASRRRGEHANILGELYSVMQNALDRA